MRILVSIHGCLVLLLVGGMFSTVAGQTGDKEKKKTAKRKVEAEAPPSLSKLDKLQIESLTRIDRMFQKLFGLAEPLPDDAAETVRSAVYNTLNGTHEPKHAASDKVANLLIDGLRGQQIPASVAHLLVRDTADTLAADNLSRDDVDGFKLEAQQKLAATNLSEAKSQELLDSLEQLVLSGKRNEKKVEERVEAKRQEEERKEKERKKKLEEEIKKAERKAKAGPPGASGGSSRPSRPSRP